MFKDSAFVPKSAPEALHPLFTEECPGDLISYDLDCPLLLAIIWAHGDMPAVVQYVKHLQELRSGSYRSLERTTKLGARKVLSSKSYMIDCILKHYGCERYKGKAWWVKRCYAFFNELTIARSDLKIERELAESHLATERATSAALRAELAEGEKEIVHLGKRLEETRAARDEAREAAEGFAAKLGLGVEW